MTLNWIDSRYNSSRAKIGRLIYADVSWRSTSVSEPSGYLVKVGEAQLSALAPTLKEGKARAEVLARKLLAEALKDLAE